ncbi:MAG: SurA N-terminal domain-containing protein [Candidatus Nanopelagicaceae bacterium]
MKKLIGGLFAIASLFLLTACDAGVAAQIGDTKISQNTVQSRVSEILSERGNYQTSEMQLSYGEELNRAELRFLVIATIFQKLAEENSIKVTKAMVDTRKREILEQLGSMEQLSQALVSAQLAPSDFDSYVKSILISEQLSELARAGGATEENVGAVIQNLVRELTGKIGIKINPQYGTWDSQAADLIAFDAAGTAVKPLLP